MTATQLDVLQRPLPIWHPKAWYFALMKASMNTVGRLSHGIRLGHRYGFDSGVMLDHVYSDRARGSGLLGRTLDRLYLNAPGWAGIRNRGRLVTRTLVRTLRAEEKPDGTPLRLADLACGGGQYVLDALAEARDVPVRSVLRDYRAENVVRAGINAEARNVTAKVERADAFSDEDLDRLGELDIAIVSGLHEIVSDDVLVKAHFRQIAHRLRPGGVLLVTVQPRHPQLEFIARVLTTHRGEAWAMRLRSVDLIAGWAREAGLRLLDREMEETGIFGVLRFRRD